MTNGTEKRIVDKAWHLVNEGKVLVDIGGKYYIAFANSRPIALQEVSETWLKGRTLEEFLDYEYIVRDLEKRSGYNVELGRIITSEELAEVKTKYGATVGEPFADQKGAFYGKEYTKHYTSVNIRIDDTQALALETELKEKCVEACNVAPGIVSVRVD